MAQGGFGSWVGVAGIDTHKSKFGLMGIIIIIITTNKLLIFLGGFILAPSFIAKNKKKSAFICALYFKKKKYWRSTPMMHFINPASFQSSVALRPLTFKQT